MKRTLVLLVPAAVAAVTLGVAAIGVAASSPAVATGSSSHVSDSAAVLHGSVNPNGGATTYYFQWGLTPAYGLQSVAHSAGHGTRSVAVSTTAGSLIPGTVYHYRVVATNAAGTTVGADRAFTTAGNPPPTVATGPATQLGKNGAIVTAVVNPNDQATLYYFQYGTSAAYGTQTIAAALPAGTAPVTVSAALGGLEARTIFHYRIVALHLGSRRIGSTLVPLGPDCRFAAQTVLGRLPGHGRIPRPVAVTVVAHYLGNGYLTPHKTSGQTVNLG